MASRFRSRAENQVYFFVPSEGIDIVVLAAYLKAFVDATATIKPSRHPGDTDRLGYTIGANVTLGREALEDVLADSRDWSKEQQSHEFEDSAYDYVDSDTWQARKSSGPTPLPKPEWAPKSRIRQSRRHGFFEAEARTEQTPSSPARGSSLFPDRDSTLNDDSLTPSYSASQYSRIFAPPKPPPTDGGLQPHPEAFRHLSISDKSTQQVQGIRQILPRHSRHDDDPREYTVSELEGRRTNSYSSKRDSYGDELSLTAIKPYQENKTTPVQRIDPAPPTVPSDSLTPVSHGREGESQPAPGPVPEPERLRTRSRRSSSSSNTSISSIMTVQSVDTEVARKFRKDFVPVRLSTPDGRGIFRKTAPSFPALAFIDNGSSGNFMSQKLCTQIHATTKLWQDNSKQYHGPSGEEVKVTGETRLQVCWQLNDRQDGAKIDFKVVAGLTFDIIITFEMAKTTGMDLAAGPHPENPSYNAVAPISSTLLPMRTAQQNQANENLKMEKMKENEKKEAERKRQQKELRESENSSSQFLDELMSRIS